MTKSLKYCLLFLAAGILFSCKKNISTVTLESGTPPVLTANKTTINLSFANKDQEAVTLKWTNPGYKFSTGPSSQNVSYLLEIDTIGSNFTNPSRKTVSIGRDLSYTMTQNDLNDYILNQLNLRAGVPHQIEMRVTASLVNNAAPLPSNVLKYTITPYAIPPKVTPPASGKLFITGSATPASWQCACGEPELLSQKFMQVSPTLYVLPSIALSGGNSYLLLPVYGSWGAKYGFDGSNNGNDPNSFDFKDGGGDIKAPAASGNYKIEVDFQRGKVTVIKL
jgi:hypothetical protein